VSVIELQARIAWIEWGEYAMYTRCEECGDSVYCRRRTRRGRWLCLVCFDISNEAERWLRR